MLQVERELNLMENQEKLFLGMDVTPILIASPICAGFTVTTSMKVCTMALLAPFLPASTLVAREGARDITKHAAFNC